MVYKRNGVFIKLFGVLILSGVFFVAPANSNVASKEYVDRNVSNVDTSQLSNYEIKTAFIENANTGDEVSVVMDGIRFLARKSGVNAGWWAVRIKNETNATMSLGITFTHFYGGGHQGYTETANIAVGAEYNPDGQPSDVGYGGTDTVFMYIFDLNSNRLYRISVIVNTKRASVIVEKLH